MTEVTTNISKTNAVMLDEILEPSPLQKLRKRIFKHHSFMIGLIILLAIAAVALFAPFLAPHDPYDHELSSRLMA